LINQKSNFAVKIKSFQIYLLLSEFKVILVFLLIMPVLATNARVSKSQENCYDSVCQLFGVTENLIFLVE